MIPSVIGIDVRGEGRGQTLYWETVKEEVAEDKVLAVSSALT